ncbi:MAG: FKBP-type peptidyl-prolyl cis-trans isomerase [Flavobacteriales bacterium]|nr:FKBP-type peptidyl-prolyl cis-trans isomerase [Flavobacteriales bacterium]
MKWSLLLLMLGAACGTGVNRATKDQAPSDRDQLIRANRDAMRLEDQDIDLYIKRHDLHAERSATGIRMQIIRDSAGIAAQPEQIAVIRYKLELLNGTVVHETASDGPEAFRVAHDNVESGLHEAVQRLSPGDSALVIIPSYRAHGLVGDLDRIPPRTSVVYRIGMVRIVP